MKLILFLSIILVTIFSSACVATVNTATSTTATITANTSTPKSTVIEVNAQQLFSAYYKSNIIAADTKYKGKTLQVSGAVGVITIDDSGIPYIELWGGQPTSAYESGMGLTSLGVQCFFSIKDMPALSQLTLNQNVTIKGTGASWNTDYEEDNVILDNCTLVQAPAQTPIPSVTIPTLVTAQQLFSAYYKNNIIAANLEYKGKTFQVSGVAKVITTDDSGIPYIELWGGQPTSAYESGMGLTSLGVQCFFSIKDMPALSQLTLNQNVIIKGTGGSWNTDYEEDNVILDNCSLVK